MMKSEESFINLPDRTTDAIHAGSGEMPDVGASNSSHNQTLPCQYIYRKETEMDCPHCKIPINLGWWNILDTELPERNRVQALFWQKQYLIMASEARKAAKGIKRLKKREQYLLECIKNNNEYYEKRMRLCHPVND